MKSIIQNIFTLSMETLAITHEFLQTHGLTHFSFIRAINKFEYYILTTHPQLSADYLENKFYSLDQGEDPHLNLENESLLWIAKEKHPVFQPIFNHAKEYYNLGNGIAIPFTNVNYSDICFFATLPSFVQINELYLNHLDLFKKFYAFFIEEAHELMRIANQRRIILPKLYDEATAHQISDKNLLSNKKLVSNSYLFLTPREIECLKWAAQGKTSLEIGSILDLSGRTVEQHIVNCKTKLNTYKLSNLIYKAAKLGLI